MSDAEKIEQRPANHNPWYCLATLYGEQPAEGDLDKDLAAKNRIAWNRWISEPLSDEQRRDVLRNGIPNSELTPFSPAERSEFDSTFAFRIGRRKAEMPPDPAKAVDFANSHFDRLVIFDGFLFTGTVDFRTARFSGSASFGSATFSGPTHFGLAMFSSFALFGRATFSDIASFGSATFSDIADFSSATFSGPTNFGSATFSGSTSFGRTTFFLTDFGSATFSGPTHFNSATFSSLAHFGSATFSADAGFINAEFTTKTIFADACFKSRVPDLRGAKMHEATEWHRVKWPDPPDDKESAQAQVYAYERLKQEMERLKKHEDEQFFFRKELRARRGLLRSWSMPWLVNYAYEASSVYGQSVVWPIFWLLVVFEFGTAVFALFPVFNGAPMSIPSAVGLSAANIFSFLPIKREIMTAEMVAGLSAAAQFVGTVQSLLGVVLLFLLGLALRNQFRMK